MRLSALDDALVDGGLRDGIAKPAKVMLPTTQDLVDPQNALFSY